MPPYRRCRMHDVDRPDLRQDFFIYAITQVLPGGISSNGAISPPGVDAKN